MGRDLKRKPSISSYPTDWECEFQVFSSTRECGGKPMGVWGFWEEPGSSHYLTLTELFQAPEGRPGRKTQEEVGRI